MSNCRLLTIAVLAVAQANAVTTLFDFETDAEVNCWHNERATTLGADKQLELSSEFVASGEHSLRFWTGQWVPSEHNGQQRWPAFEGTPPLTDWSPYARLVFELVNATDLPQKLRLFITDSKIATRSGLSGGDVLPPRTRAQYVLELKTGFAAHKVNPKDIRTIHIYTEDPPEDLVIYFDRFLLLKPGEPIPALPARYLKELATLQEPAIVAAQEGVARAAARLRNAAAESPAAAAWVTSQLAQLDRQLKDLLAKLGAGDEAVLDAPRLLADVAQQADRLATLLALRVKFDALRSEVGPDAPEGLVAAFATSMEKILPRAGVPSVTVAPEYSVSLAQNEKESIQLIVLPMEGELKQAEVRVGDLAGPLGATLPSEQVDCVTMGYVDTKTMPPYGSSHVGWWPDPILEFQHTTDIAEGDAQSFWIRVHTPADQAAGRYHGKLELLSAGRPVMTFKLNVRVYGFALPDRSPLPLAITFGPHDHPTEETKAQQAEWRKSDDYPINAWKPHKLAWADFLADYLIPYDSLYHRDVPDFEILKRLRDGGRLGWFNLGYYGPIGEGEGAEEKWRESTLPRLRQGYQQAKALGMLDRAYIYGCDEAPAAMFPRVQRAAAILKQEFPGALIMTTTYDHSFGLETDLKAIDAWCPLTPRMDLERAAAARAVGREVWWYICCGPRHAYANMFIEYPAIEGRLLMGPMTAKYQPDGFLYYQISIWNSEHGISSGPFTDWDARSWTTFHGDGSWTCVKDDGTPLPTIRLENFRDGLEDYGYQRVLLQTLLKVQADPALAVRGAKWLKEAEAALTVPTTLVESLTTYSREPAEYYAWRARLAAAIEAAPTAPAAL